MATITLKYNAHNTLAAKTLEYILSLGVFNAQPKVTAVKKSSYNLEFVAKIREREKCGFVEKDIHSIFD
jgi:hypothetical protein